LIPADSILSFGADIIFSLKGHPGH